MTIFRFMAKLKEKEQRAEQQKLAAEQNSFDSIQQLKPENLLQVSPKENALSDLISKTSSTISWPTIQKSKSPTKSPLPPVEISTADSTANLT